MRTTTKTRPRLDCVEGCGSHAQRNGNWDCVVLERVRVADRTVGVTYVRFPVDAPPAAFRDLWRRGSRCWTGPRPLPRKPSATWAPIVEWARKLVADPPPRRSTP